VFSNEAGGYGTGLSEGTLATEAWGQAGKGGGDAQLTDLYLARMGHAANAGEEASAAAQRPSAYASNLAQVDAALLSRTSNTYGMMTSDDPFQYLGGIALAVRQLTGRDPALYVQNLRDDSEVKTDSVAKSLAMEMQTRYLHPQWIKSQQAEGYSGTLQVLKTANFLWGWQVTAPQTVRQDHWQSLHNVYVRDQYQLRTRQWLEGENRAAFAQTLERMLDAVRLNYWQPDAATRQELAQAYTAALKATDLRASNAAVQRFAQAELAEGSPPLSLAATRPPASPAQAASHSPDTAAPNVRGLQLLPQPALQVPSAASTLVSTLASLLAIAVLLAAGALRQQARGRQHRPYT
jgi:cobaltochelatase CobN